jgi:hypothetical protein
LGLTCQFLFTPPAEIDVIKLGLARLEIIEDNVRRCAIGTLGESWNPKTESEK